MTINKAVEKWYVIINKSIAGEYEERKNFKIWFRVTHCVTLK